MWETVCTVGWVRVCVVSTVNRILSLCFVGLSTVYCCCSALLCFSVEVGLTKSMHMPQRLLVSLWPDSNAEIFDAARTKVVQLNISSSIQVG